MGAKSYNPVQSDHKLIDIIEHLLQQTAPISGAALAKALGMPHGTVMSHLIVALDRKWVRQTGDLYEVGLRLMGMYSAYKMGLIDRRDALDRKIELLEA